KAAHQSRRRPASAPIAGAKCSARAAISPASFARSLTDNHVYDEASGTAVFFRTPVTVEPWRPAGRLSCIRDSRDRDGNVGRVGIILFAHAQHARQITAPALHRAEQGHGACVDIPGSHCRSTDEALNHHRLVGGTGARAIAQLATVVEAPAVQRLFRTR